MKGRMANMNEFHYYDNGWYDGDDLHEMGGREAWEDTHAERDAEHDLGDLYDLEDEEPDADCDDQVAPDCDW